MMEIDGNANIPTVLYYASNRVLVGSEAIAQASERHLVNEDFKIELGNYEPGSTKVRTRFPTASGASKTAAELTFDFFGQVIKSAESWLLSRDIPFGAGTSVLIAEPLVLETAMVSDEWLSNYRRNLQRILAGKGFETIDFLPEPFAVFQYYRYGLKHPIVAQRAKIRALVIDIGGGTCDVCIIETTREGDISLSGRNSKPLAAASAPVAGFFFNRAITENVFLKHRHADKIKHALKIYKRWRREGGDLKEYDPAYRAFIKNFHAAVYRMEDIKLSVCRSVTDWGLEAPLNFRVPFTMPEDPLVEGGRTTTVFVTAAELRQVFIEALWKQHLKGLISTALNYCVESWG
jgi:hypothetical protein